MNELEAQLAKVVEKSLSLAEKTGDFVIEQAPMLLQEFYMWHISKNVMTIVGCILLYGLVRYIISFFGKKEPFSWVEFQGRSYEETRESMEVRGRYYRNDEFAAGRIAIHVVGLGISCAVALSAVYNIVFITVAPKLYLIEYFIK